MKAIVNINGLIGNWEEEKGVELTDVVAQIQAQKGFDEVEVRIGNSGGGLVDVGKDIYDYLRSLKKPITTIIDNYCASITSIIFLAGDKRLMKKDAVLMIHNPWGKPEGNADELELYASELREIEKMLSTVYNKVTGIGQEALLALMRNETEMSAEEAVKLGFSTGLVDETKIIANLKIDKMSKNKKTLKEQLANIMSKLKGDDPVNLILQDGAGKEIVFETENEAPTIGDKATIDGAPANGEFTMPDGKIFVFEAGELKEIKEADGGDNELANTIRDIVREEISAMNETVQEVVEISSSLVDKYAVLAKSVKSNYQHPKDGKKNQMGNKGVDDVYSKYQPKKKED